MMRIKEALMVVETIILEVSAIKVSVEKSSLLTSPKWENLIPGMMKQIFPFREEEQLWL